MSISCINKSEDIFERVIVLNTVNNNTILPATSQFSVNTYGWPDPFLIPNALAMQDLIELWLPPDRDFYIFPDATTVDIESAQRTTVLPPGARTHRYLFHGQAIGLVEVRAVWLDGRLFKRAKHCRIIRMRPADCPAAQAALNGWLCSEPRPLSIEGLSP
jgi:hypothetical protein